MNEDKNDVALDQAPATVDGQKVLSVVQVSISDIPAEDGYKVLLANAETAVVPLDQFSAGVAISSAPEAPVVDNPTEEATAQTVATDDQAAAQTPTQPTVDPTAGANQAGGTQ